MNNINHITLNSGHIRKTNSNEVSKDLYFTLNRIYKDSFEEIGTELFDGYTVKSTFKEIHGVITTIFDTNGIPVFTTASVINFESKMWEILHESSALPLRTNIDTPPQTPYIADRLEQGYFLHLDVSEWSGDFARCFGWMYINPKSILK
ncbi:hypothetical protein [Lysinibacillus fusiformis]|uniref:hypothetical protein n=1 Tax=Lysinibacillus fusiformis TaxID=28031 RepID=UPI000D3C592E|nr:hypothetical protein [Lysinibacillus fusiformis]MED4672351.1 hypothetical protein [Lysinibacillus fusiformis]RDV32250.1 hypothetical protein C7B90_11035 [Lysinibacillus fusiformis]GED65609.1 hypothetical protein LFU01_40610 [Lysinibacillus fusiformis]